MINYKKKNITRIPTKPSVIFCKGLNKVNKWGKKRNSVKQKIMKRIVCSPQKQHC